MKVTSDQNISGGLVFRRKLDLFSYVRFVLQEFWLWLILTILMYAAAIYEAEPHYDSGYYFQDGNFLLVVR